MHVTKMFQSVKFNENPRKRVPCG